MIYKATISITWYAVKHIIDYCIWLHFIVIAYQVVQTTGKNS